MNKAYQIPSLSNCLPFFIIFLWGFGQILPYSNWYLHGVALPDFLAILYLAFFIYFDEKFRNKISRALIRHWYPMTLTLSLIVVLTFSTILNYEGPTSYIPYLLLSIFRSGYFFMVAILVSIWAEQEERRNLLIIFYLLSLILVLSWYVINSHSNESLGLWGKICSLPIIDQRNVVGNLMGVGLIFSTLLLLESGLVFGFISAVFFMVLIYFLLFTYSKGAWLIGLVTLFGYLPLLLHRKILAFVFICFAVIFLQLHGSQIKCLFDAKMVRNADSISERLSYALNASSDAIKNPYGKGIGWAIPGTKNTQSTTDTKNEVGLTGFSSYNNPHSAFLHILQAGGWVAFGLYILLFIYPFYLLLLLRGWRFKIFAIVSGCAFFISGVTQLQIYSQQFYWIFTGLVFSLTLKSVENR